MMTIYPTTASRSRLMSLLISDQLTSYGFIRNPIAIGRQSVLHTLVFTKQLVKRIATPRPLDDELAGIYRDLDRHVRTEIERSQRRFRYRKRDQAATPTP